MKYYEYETEESLLPLISLIIDVIGQKKHDILLTFIYSFLRIIMLYEPCWRICDTFNPSRHPEVRQKIICQILESFLKNFPIIQRFLRSWCAVWILICCWYFIVLFTEFFVDYFLENYEQRLFLWSYTIAEKEMFTELHIEQRYLYL